MRFKNGIPIGSTIAVSFALYGCSSSQELDKSVSMHAVSLLHEGALPQDAEIELNRALALRAQSLSEYQIVSITTEHSGVWKIRDRQLTNDGTAYISDYEIKIYANQPVAHLTGYFEVENAANQIALIVGVVQSFEEHADKGEYSTGTSYKVYATVSGACWGESWLRPYNLSDLFEGIEAGAMSAQPVRASVALESAVRILDQNLLSEYVSLSSDLKSFALAPE